MKAEIIKQCIDDYFGYDIAKRNRQRNYIKARLLYYRFCKDLTRLSLGAMAKLLDGRDHATALHALKDWNQTIKDQQFETDYHELNAIISPKLDFEDEEKKVAYESVKNSELLLQRNKTISYLRASIIKIEYQRQKEVKILKTSIRNAIGGYKEIKELLSLPEDKIKECCKFRIKPFLLMNK